MGTAWTFRWDDAAIERLKTLWFSGFSASECGKEFGVSRNSIIGVVHRRGWQRMLRRQRPPASKAVRLAGPTLAPEEPLPEPPARLPKTEQPVSKPKKKRLPGPPRLKVVALKPDPPIGSFGIMDLRHGVCKWPVSGEVASEFKFCGDQALEGAPYCNDHHRKAHHASASASRSSSAAFQLYPRR